MITVLQFMVSNNNVWLTEGKYKHMINYYLAANYDKHTTAFQTVIIKIQASGIYGIYGIYMEEVLSKV